MLRLGDFELDSRLLLRAEGHFEAGALARCLDAAGARAVTVAVLGLDAPGAAARGLDPARFLLIPDTAGCLTPEDAALTANMGREVFGTPLVRLDVQGDPASHLPDAEGTLEAARALVQEGFQILAACGPDLVTARRLADIGCVALVVNVAPPGSALGLLGPANFGFLVDGVPIPVLAGGGLCSAADAAAAMELGAAGALVGTAISGAQEPVGMARAFGLAVEAGRAAREAGRALRRWPFGGERS